MPKCFSLLSVINWSFRRSFNRAGLRLIITDLGEGTSMHCWAPKSPNPSKPNLVLIHGVGANALWSWNGFIAPLVAKFNVYAPDLVFIGDSFTTRTERSEQFQASSVMALMEAHGVSSMIVVGLSYGGFVAYSMAAKWPGKVQRVVLYCAGVAMEEKDMEMEGFLKVKSVDETVELLFPKSVEKMKEMLEVVYHKPPKRMMPSCFVQEFIDEICTKHIQEKIEVIQALNKNRTLSDLPKIAQPMLMIWGEYDQVFPLELAHRLRRHLEEHNNQIELVIIKNAGHAINMEKPKEMSDHLIAYLTLSTPNLFLLFEARKSSQHLQKDRIGRENNETYYSNHLEVERIQIRVTFTLPFPNTLLHHNYICLR